MMARIEYINDETGSFQEAAGSDNRLNVSSRSDNRAYYNSRDDEQCYTIVYTHLAATDAEFSFYLKNTSSTLTMVVSSVGVNCDTVDTRFKLWFVTGTASNGASVTPTNLNRHSSNAADATALESAGGTAISGPALDALIDMVHLQASGHEEFRLTDRVRLGQNDAIALEADENTAGTADIAGVVFFYFE